MLELNISKLEKSFSGTLLFTNITFDLKTRERVGLVGPNGSGKTTILKIISDLERSDDGIVSFRKDASVGYLDQIPQMEDTVLVSDILMMPFLQLEELSRKIKELTNSFTGLVGEQLEESLQRYTVLEEQYDKAGGYLIETTINKVCSGLQITDDMRKLTFNLLSGGEKTRVMLAKILLEKPTILLLDEPSNHLDLDAIEWLESYLREYEGSVLLVSHDRYFLDNVCNKIVELTSSKANLYYGNYSYYVIEKERRFLLELKAYINQEKQIKRMEDQIKRYRIWGVMRDSDKMFRRAKELEKRLEKIEKFDKPKKENQSLSIKNIESTRSGKRVLSIHDLSKQYDSTVIFKEINLDVFYQNRVGIIGMNGSGKTTLLTMVLNEYKKDNKKIVFGSKVKIGYLPQEIIFKDEEQSILEYFIQEHDTSQIEARKHLANASFLRDDVFKKISTLSGGEKSKLILTSLTYEDVNLMILDEPTNHLDIDSREVLEDVLMEFTGTILFVSHDRYFIKKIANRIAEIHNQHLELYEGDYEYYRSHKKQEESVKKNKKIRVKQKKSNKELDYSVILEELEEKIKEVEKQIEEHAFDYELLNQYYQEKETLEEEYFSILEDSLN